MKNLLRNGWTIMRIVRLAAGVTASTFAMVNSDILLGIAGVFLLLMSIFNIGCGGAGNCAFNAGCTTRKTSAGRN